MTKKRLYRSKVSQETLEFFARQEGRVPSELDRIFEASPIPGLTEAESDELTEYLAEEGLIEEIEEQ